MKSEEHGAKRTSFDGRLGYFDTLHALLAGVSKFQLEEDYRSWYRVLRSVFSASMFPLPADQRKKVRGSLDYINSLLRAYYRNAVKDGFFARRQAEAQGFLENALWEATDLVYNALHENNLLLPYGDGDEDTLDLAEAMKRAGFA